MNGERAKTKGTHKKTSFESNESFIQRKEIIQKLNVEPAANIFIALKREIEREMNQQQ